MIWLLLAWLGLFVAAMLTAQYNDRLDAQRGLSDG